MKYNRLFYLTFVLCLSLSACSQKINVDQWVSTTYASPWQSPSTELILSEPSDSLIIIDPTQTAQTIEGFGSSFSELSWTSLSQLDPDVRGQVLNELYSPNGFNLTVNRMPIGANDFSLDFYSFNEVDGDFEMKNFSIERDLQYLIPFIKAAKQVNPNFKLWASPWCPPSWMKINKHYASRSSRPRSATAFGGNRQATGGHRPQGGNRPPQDRLGQDANHPAQQAVNPLQFRMEMVDNGLPEDRQTTKEGTDAFIQEEAYLKAYALYFGKFIDAYKEQGIDIFMVMPQNEFNSAQNFPSCLWSPRGLVNFIKYLGPQMEQRQVDIYLGTIERANAALADTVLTDPVAGKYIKGCGFQWAGKDALPVIQKNYPNLTLYQTEQECGNGLNNWEGAMHSWDLMKHYFGNGVNVYTYWNTSLLENGVSHWGWRQNSLVVVNDTTHTFKYTPEAYVLKHSSHFVQPGAKRIVLAGNYTDALAFVNPDQSIAVIFANQTNAQYPVSIQVNGKTVTIPAAAGSLQTLLLH